MYEPSDGGVQFGDIICIAGKESVEPVPQGTGGVEEDAVTDEGLNHNYMDKLFLGKPRKIYHTSETAMVAASDLEKQRHLLNGKTAGQQQRTQLLHHINRQDTYIFAKLMHIVSRCLILRSHTQVNRSLPEHNTSEKEIDRWRKELGIFGDRIVVPTDVWSTSACRT